MSLAEQAVDMVKLSVRHNGDEMDIRAYVKVKHVEWGVGAEGGQQVGGVGDGAWGHQGGGGDRDRGGG